MKIVKIIGSGCSKCKSLERLVKELIEANNLNCELIKITDLTEMINYGILMTPALIIDDQLKSVGSVPSKKQLLQWLTEKKS